MIYGIIYATGMPAATFYGIATNQLAYACASGEHYITGSVAVTIYGNKKSKRGNFPETIEKLQGSNLTSASM
jgi:hypothetical protein